MTNDAAERLRTAILEELGEHFVQEFDQALADAKQEGVDEVQGALDIAVEELYDCRRATVERIRAALTSLSVTGKLRDDVAAILDAEAER
jgi:hypothetical protein